MTISRLNNIKEGKAFRRLLRNHLTPAEARLWMLLKGKQLDGRKFRRQHGVGKYVLDFYCPAEKLAVELDGEYHFTDAGCEKDNERTVWLELQGISVIRFENQEVFNDPERVLRKIRSHFRSS